MKGIFRVLCVVCIFWGVSEAASPSAPTNLQVAGVSSSSVDLSWVAPTFNGDAGAVIQGYLVTFYQRLTAAAVGPAQQKLVLSDDTSYTLSGLSSTTVYVVNVVARNDLGQVSAASNNATFETTVGPASAPRNVRITSTTSGTVAIAWDSPVYTGGAAATIVSSKITYQRINGPALPAESVDTVKSGNATAFTITFGLAPGTQYSIVVSATNSAGVRGTSSTPIVAETVVSAPSTPTGLTSTPSTKSIGFVWAAPATTGGALLTIANTTIRIQRLQGPSAAYTPDNLNSDGAATSFVASGLASGTAYAVKIAFTNSAGLTSSWSAILNTQTVIATPSAPTAFAVCGLATGAPCNVSWTVPTETGGWGVTIVGYAVHVTRTSGTPGTTFTVTKTPTDYYHVFSTLDAGSAFSAEVQALSSADLWSESGAAVFQTAFAAPTVPTSLTASGAVSSVIVTWNPPTSTGGTLASIAFYNVSCRPALGGAVVKTSATGSPTTISGLAGGVTYSVWATATSTAGLQSPTSAVVNATALFGLHVSLALTTISGSSGPISGTITRDDVTSEPLSVSLVSSAPGLLTVLPLVTIAASASSTTFTATPVPGALTSDATIVVTATAPMHGTASTTVNMQYTAPRFVVTWLTAARTTQLGGASSFSIALAQAPSGNVVLPVTIVSTASPSPATLSASELTFTAGMWSATQQLTVTGVATAAALDVPFAVKLGPASGGGAFFAGAEVVLDFINAASNNAGWIVMGQTRYQGPYAYLDMTLSFAPKADVVVPVALNGLNSSSLAFTFSPASWNTAQTVIVPLPSAPNVVTLAIGPTRSGDTRFAGLIVQPLYFTERSDTSSSGAFTVAANPEGPMPASVWISLTVVGVVLAICAVAAVLLIRWRRKRALVQHATPFKTPQLDRDLEGQLAINTVESMAAGVGFPKSGNKGHGQRTSNDSQESEHDEKAPLTPTPKKKNLFSRFSPARSPLGNLSNRMKDYAVGGDHEARPSFSLDAPVGQENAYPPRQIEVMATPMYAEADTMRRHARVDTPVEPNSSPARRISSAIPTHLRSSVRPSAQQQASNTPTGAETFQMRERGNVAVRRLALSQPPLPPVPKLPQAYPTPIPYLDRDEREHAQSEHGVELAPLPVMHQFFAHSDEERTHSDDGLDENDPANYPLSDSCSGEDSPTLRPASTALARTGAHALSSATHVASRGRNPQRPSTAGAGPAARRGGGGGSSKSSAASDDGKQRPMEVGTFRRPAVPRGRARGAGPLARSAAAISARGRGRGGRGGAAPQQTVESPKTPKRAVHFR